ncbi:S41 family peptidase [Fredinandcohnia sp. QZ13]|uniref:S41 family peptidase n=1 Tax=Fredinandcohnia sp. QZ13 TaxID=3073144 RepID=UPI002853199D|nr:S41 family peptidase [Fredinandcohnia sp. QZ13]MDR4890102.1 S41 family peptidase [Fredinandcohnia sp. QZ13]
MKNWYLRIGVLLAILLGSTMIVGSNFVKTELQPERLRFYDGGEFEKAPFPPSAENPLGTDADGIDIFSVLIHGLDDTVRIILLITIMTFLMAIPLAFLASNQQGLAHWIIQGLSYLFSSLPPILAVVLILSTPYVDSSPIRKELMILTIAIVGVGRVGYLFQQQIVQLSRKEYMHAGLILGNNPFQMYIRHYLPNLWPSFMSNFFLEAGRVTLLAGQLALFSYFFKQKLVIKDVGDYEWQSADFDWLSFLASGRTEIIHAFWIPLFPALAIAILIITFQLLGEGLRLKFHTKSAKQQNGFLYRAQLIFEGLWFDYIRGPLIKIAKNPMVLSLVCLFILISNSSQTIPVFTPASGTNSWVDKERQLANVTAFANLYGYVRFFHPSDEVEEVDWNQFALYGMEKVNGSKNEQELKENLEEIFQPIAPTLKIYRTDEEYDRYVPDYKKLRDSAYELVVWQYEGVKIKENLSFLPLLTEEEMQDKLLILGLNQSYKSKRVYNSFSNGKFSIWALPLFNHFPNEKDVIEEPINQELKIQLPLTLVSYQKSTDVDGENQEFLALQNQLKKIDVFSEDTMDPIVQLSNVVIVWNIVKYFYPHYEIVDVDMNQQLNNAIKELLPPNYVNYVQFKHVLERMLRPLNDGHINITDKQYHTSKYLPFWADVFDGEVVVTAVSEDSPFKVGDVIVERSGESAIEWINDVIKLESGTQHYREFAALKRFVRDLDGRKEESFTLKRDGQQLKIKATYHLSSMVDRFHRSPGEGYKYLGNDIYYVNIDYFTEVALEEFQHAKGIVFDFRGYPATDISALFHKLSEEIVYTMPINVPQIMYPNKHPVGFQENQGRYDPKGETFTRKIVALIDGSCISACETYAETFKGNGLATMIGGPTAGTNGAINLIKLPGNMGVWFTAMQALNVDWSQHHMIGVQPDIIVERTREGALEGRDEQLEAAVEYLKREIDED